MATDTSAPRQQQASRRLGQGRSSAGSAARRKSVATLARSAQIARRADPPGPLFHRAIWPAMGSGAGAVTGADTLAGSVMGIGAGPGAGKPGRGSGTGEGEGPGKSPDPGAGAGERPGQGADTGAGTGAADQDACRARRAGDGAPF